MIKESGGIDQRTEPGHYPDGISPHHEPHINYTTDDGPLGRKRATVIIQSWKDWRATLTHSLG